MCIFHLQGTSLFDYTLRSERHPLEIECIVDHDIRGRERKLVFRADGIQIMVVDVNSDLSVLLGNGNNIGHPTMMLLFSDEIRVYKLFDF